MITSATRLRARAGVCRSSDVGARACSAIPWELAGLALGGHLDCPRQWYVGARLVRGAAEELRRLRCLTVRQGDLCGAPSAVGRVVGAVDLVPLGCGGGPALDVLGPVDTCLLGVPCVAGCSRSPQGDPGPNGSGVALLSVREVAVEGGFAFRQRAVAGRCRPRHERPAHRVSPRRSGPAASARISSRRRRRGQLEVDRPTGRQARCGAQSIEDSLGHRSVALVREGCEA